jgi:RNA polymerase-binding transcription factor DksA
MNSYTMGIIRELPRIRIANKSNEHGICKQCKNAIICTKRRYVQHRHYCSKECQINYYKELQMMNVKIYQRAPSVKT